ncbi:hypothetical protein BGX27_002750, partial [Mortierella sp. AM989]
MRTGFLSALAMAVVSVINATLIHDHERALENMEKRVDLLKDWDLLNDWDCKPNKEHPFPLVLVHATLAPAGLNWVYHGTRFRRKNYCVFLLSYGQRPLNGLGPIEDSAKELKEFVDKVLMVTKAPQVDMLGHSQGGLMPLYYMKRLDGARNVHKFGALAPATHGSSASGLAILFSLPLLTDVAKFFCPACDQMKTDSKFLKDLFQDGETVPNVPCFMLATTWDTAVTPYNNSFLRSNSPLVKNKTIQEYCNVPVDHSAIFVDLLAFNIMDDSFTPSAGR